MSPHQLPNPSRSTSPAGIIWIIREPAVSAPTPAVSPGIVQYLQPSSQAAATDGSNDGLWRVLNLFQHLLSVLRELSHFLSSLAGFKHAEGRREVDQDGKSTTKTAGKRDVLTSLSLFSHNLQCLTGRQELLRPQFWIRQHKETKPRRVRPCTLTRAVPEALNGIPCARALEALGRGGRVIGSLKALARKGRGKSPGSLFRRADGQCSDATLPIRDSLCQLFSWRLAACARQEQFGRLEMLRPGDTS